jgi:dolichol-phosphate mannosyltransferase
LRVAVIIPTYNEAENLQPMVSALFLLPLDLKVYIVDDHSPDGTGRIADELARENQGMYVIHRAGKMGLRSAYITGIQQALNDGADAVVQMDADFSHDPARIPDMARLLESCDVVLGSRYVAGGSVDTDWAAWRKALSGFANFYARSILGMPQKDVTTGFRMWRRLTLQGMPLDRIEANGYVFLVEMAYLAYCLEYKIGELPIYFAERRSGESKMSLKIQAEAAMRVGFVRWIFRDLRKAGKRARLPIPADGNS